MTDLLGWSEQAMLTVSLVVVWWSNLFNRFGNSFQDYLSLARDHGQADHIVVPWVSFLLLKTELFRSSGISFNSHELSKTVERGLATT